MNIEESKKFLTDRGMKVSAPYGYTLTVGARGYSTEGPYQIPMDEMDAVLFFFYKAGSI